MNKYALRKALKSALKLAFNDLSRNRQFVASPYEIESRIESIIYKLAGEFEEAIKGKKFKNPETGNEVQFGSLPAEEQKKLRTQFKSQVKSEGVGGGGKDKKEDVKLIKREVEKTNERFDKDPKFRAKTVDTIVKDVGSAESKNKIKEGLKKFVNAEDFSAFGSALKNKDPEGMKKALPGMVKGMAKGLLAVLGTALLVGGTSVAVQKTTAKVLENKKSEMEKQMKEEHDKKIKALADKAKLDDLVTDKLIDDLVKDYDPEQEKFIKEQAAKYKDKGLGAVAEAIRNGQYTKTDVANDPTILANIIEHQLNTDIKENFAHYLESETEAFGGVLPEVVTKKILDEKKDADKNVVKILKALKEDSDADEFMKKLEEKALEKALIEKDLAEKVKSDLEASNRVDTDDFFKTEAQLWTEFSENKEKLKVLDINAALDDDLDKIITEERDNLYERRYDDAVKETQLTQSKEKLERELHTKKTTLEPRQRFLKMNIPNQDKYIKQIEKSLKDLDAEISAFDPKAKNLTLEKKKEMDLKKQDYKDTKENLKKQVEVKKKMEEEFGSIGKELKEIEDSVKDHSDAIEFYKKERQREEKESELLLDYQVEKRTVYDKLQKPSDVKSEKRNKQLDFVSQKKKAYLFKLSADEMMEELASDLQKEFCREMEKLKGGTKKKKASKKVASIMQDTEFDIKFY
jgi:hypothetical protein